MRLPRASGRASHHSAARRGDETPPLRRVSSVSDIPLEAAPRSHNHVALPSDTATSSRSPSRDRRRSGASVEVGRSNSMPSSTRAATLSSGASTVSSSGGVSRCALTKRSGATTPPSASQRRRIGSRRPKLLGCGRFRGGSQTVRDETQQAHRASPGITGGRRAEQGQHRDGQIRGVDVAPDRPVGFACSDKTAKDLGDLRRRG